ncbi:MAG: alpha/beta hydrolase, partial [Oscillospiraceae bacterium]
MKFREFGNSENPHIMLIHGGGNAWWNFKRQAEALSQDYHVILPTLDGHGEEYGTEYTSTENQADKLLEYIDLNCGGHLFALGGVSLGGQIVID